MVYTLDEKRVLMTIVCQSVRDGLSVRKAAELHGVTFSRILEWASESQEFGEQYKQARLAQFEHWEQDILQISDETQTGVITRDTPQGMTVESRDMIEHRKLRVSTRQWLLSKLRPEKFGDKMQLGGANDLPPIRSETHVTLSPEDAYKKMIGGT